jgi:hypothetical protein
MRGIMGPQPDTFSRGRSGRCETVAPRRPTRAAFHSLSDWATKWRLCEKRPAVWGNKQRLVSKLGANCARSPIRVLAGPCLALTLARLWP